MPQLICAKVSVKDLTEQFLKRLRLLGFFWLGFVYLKPLCHNEKKIIIKKTIVRFWLGFVYLKSLCHNEKKIMIKKTIVKMKIMQTQ